MLGLTGGHIADLLCSKGRPDSAGRRIGRTYRGCADPDPKIACSATMDSPPSDSSLGLTPQRDEAHIVAQ